MPVSATVLSIRTSDPKAAVWAAASARLLRRSATSELRALASLVPPHRRLVRTHGNESVSAQVPLHVVNKSNRSSTNGERGEEGEEGPPALVLVSEMVEGGSLRDRINAAAAAAASKETVTTAGDLVLVMAEDGSTDDVNTETAAAASAAIASTTAEEPANGEEALPPPVEGDGSKTGVAPEPAAGEEASARRQQLQQQGQLLLRRRKVLADIAEGLACLHNRGVAHGALTTDNVLLDAEGRAKVRARSRMWGGGAQGGGGEVEIPITFCICFDGWLLVFVGGCFVGFHDVHTNVNVQTWSSSTAASVIYTRFVDGVRVAVFDLSNFVFTPSHWMETASFLGYTFVLTGQRGALRRGGV